MTNFYESLSIFLGHPLTFDQNYHIGRFSEVFPELPAFVCFNPCQTTVARQIGIGLGQQSPEKTTPFGHQIFWLNDSSYIEKY